MKITIRPSPLKGNIQAPASKSSMQRACAAALLRHGRSVITNPGDSNDDRAAIEIIQALGAKVSNAGSELIVESNGVHPVAGEINCGESGLSIRMFTPIAALSDREMNIGGTGSLSTRPMDFFDEVLPRLGVRIKSSQGKLPLVVQGPLDPKDLEVDGSLSSQFLTGLLMAYSAAEGEGSHTIKVKNLRSRPYIDLTLDVMGRFGLRLPANRRYEEFTFDFSTGSHRPGTTEPCIYTVEGDWSGAAFLLVAGAISGNVLVSGLDLSTTQADRAIIDAMMAANAGIAMEAKGIRVVSTPLNAFDFDATDCPDLFPPLVALAAYCNGVTRIRGAGRLAHKESNRAVTLQDEFDAMGVRIDIEDDIMLIHGGEKVKGADVHSRQDHRIAMACAVAALGADSETTIEEAQAVKKSYPDFYDHLKSLGASITLPFQTIK